MKPKLKKVIYTQRELWYNESNRKIGLSFEIGKAIGRDEMYVASILYGQAKPTAEDIKVRIASDQPTFH